MKKILQGIQRTESKISKVVAFSDFLVESRYRNEFCMNITMVQGLLYAVVSSPCLVMPSDWTALIFGGIPEFQSIEQQKDMYETALVLYTRVESELALCDKRTDLLLWVEYGHKISLQTATNRQLVDFCSGYVKGYLLDPILRKTFADIPDLSLAFFISIIQLGAAKGKLSDIDEVMRKTLQHVMLENYLNWLEVKKLNLGKALS
jgi:yecA family protein